MRNRGKALLLSLKDGNAGGLQTPLGHADAAVADPVLQNPSKHIDDDPQLVCEAQHLCAGSSSCQLQLSDTTG